MINFEACKEKSDEEIVILTLKNEEYFSCLVHRYQEKLMYYIQRISGVSKEETEDILQDTFIKIYTNLNDFDKSLKFSSWAYRITHNQVISNFRKIKARPESISFEACADSALYSLVSDLDFEKRIDIQFLRSDVDTILKKLDITYREMLILKFFEEKSYKEISDILKKPMGTIAILLNRAKAKFKEEYIRLEKKYE